MIEPTPPAEISEIAAARNLVELAIAHGVVRDTPALRVEMRRDPVALAHAILIRGAAYVAERAR